MSLWLRCMPIAPGGVCRVVLGLLLVRKIPLTSFFLKGATVRATALVALYIQMQKPIPIQMDFGMVLICTDRSVLH